MSKFAKGINSKNAKVIIKKKKYILLTFTKLIYLLPSISCPTLELLAVMVFEISSFLCQNLQRAITQKMIFFNFHHSLLIILYNLTKFEAPSFLRYPFFYVKI